MIIYQDLLFYHYGDDLRFCDASLSLDNIVTWCQAFLTYESMNDEDGASEESEDEEHQIPPDLKDVQQQHGNRLLPGECCFCIRNTSLGVIPTLTYRSDILSCIIFGICSDILSDILSGILSLTLYLRFYLAFYLTYTIIFWHIFYLTDIPSSI